MFNYFPDYQEDAKVWIFMADRSLTREEVFALDRQVEQFLSSWQTHGRPLEAAFEIIAQQFLIVSIDSKANVQPSGCSIDALLHFVQQIEKEKQLSFTDRMQIAFEIEQEIQLLPLAAFRQKVRSQQIPEDALVFDPSIASLHALRTTWKLPLKQSWAARFLSN